MTVALIRDNKSQRRPRVQGRLQCQKTPRSGIARIGARFECADQLADQLMQHDALTALKPTKRTQSDAHDSMPDGATA